MSFFISDAHAQAAGGGQGSLISLMLPFLAADFLFFDDPAAAKAHERA